jgi:hypothetical protein
MAMGKGRSPSVFSLSKSAKEDSIQSVCLDGDEFRIAGVSPAISLCYIQHSSLKLKFAGSGRKSAG